VWGWVIWTEERGKSSGDNQATTTDVATRTSAERTTDWAGARASNCTSVALWPCHAMQMGTERKTEMETEIETKTEKNKNNMESSARHAKQASIMRQLTAIEACWRTRGRERGRERGEQRGKVERRGKWSRVVGSGWTTPFTWGDTLN